MVKPSHTEWANESNECFDQWETVHYISSCQYATYLSLSCFPGVAVLNGPYHQIVAAITVSSCRLLTLSLKLAINPSSSRHVIIGRIWIWRLTTRTRSSFDSANLFERMRKGEQSWFTRWRWLLIAILLCIYLRW